jgi:hypothetical protein
MASINVFESGAFSALWRYRVSTSVDEFLTSMIGFSGDFVLSSSGYSIKSCIVVDFAVGCYLYSVYFSIGLISRLYFDLVA